MNKERIVSVSSVLQRIKIILSETFDFSTVWIRGEVSNLTKHRSGHYYFSLKDEHGEMNCVMFSSYVRHLDFSLEEGMQVLVKGSVNVYEVRGSLQLYVKSIRPDGIGSLYMEYQKRLQRLHKEGYFDQDHKKAKPEYIEKIAVITAKEGAALQDVLKTIQKRWPMLKVDLYPSLVQGTQAPKSLISAIQAADQNDYDALLIVRGGGSFEDLFCFNDEELVKTIYACKTYTVSGVGHEVDTTLCDLVSDHRCVTPTAAAQWITLDQWEVRQKIDSIQRQMLTLLKHRLEIANRRLLQYKNHPYLQDPMSWCYEKKLRLDHLQETLANSKDRMFLQKDVIQNLQTEMKRSFQKRLSLDRLSLSYKQSSLDPSIRAYFVRQKEHFHKQIELLDASSPLKILDKGYSMVEKDQKIIKSINQVAENDYLYIHLRDGTIHAQVTSKEDKPWLKRK